VRSGLILAGGASSRFGASKALAPLRGEVLILHVARALAPHVEELLVSVGDAASEEALKVRLPQARFVRDARRNRGPLEGFRQGFADARGEIVLVAPCDAPLLCPELYALLLERLQGHDAAAVHVDVVDPTKAAYRREAALRALQAPGPPLRGPAGLLGRLDTVHVTSEDLRRAGIEATCLLDVNTPDDLRRAERALAPT